CGHGLFLLRAPARARSGVPSNHGNQHGPRSNRSRPAAWEASETNWRRRHTFFSWSKRCTASPFGQGQGLGHEKTARPQADVRLKAKTPPPRAKKTLPPGKIGSSFGGPRVVFLFQP